MKSKLWLLSLPLIAISALFQVTYDLGEQGRLDQRFLRETIYPIARSLNGASTNLKFRARGSEPVQNKIVVLAADDTSVERLGRWPWTRELYAHILHSTFKLGAKHIGIDIVFSEPEQRIPPEVYGLVKKKNPALVPELKSFEGDPVLAQVLHHYRNQIVLGYTPQAFCQPRYDQTQECPPKDLDLIHAVNEALLPFAHPERIPNSNHALDQTPLLTMITVIPNIPLLRDASSHAGFFFITPDPDGYIRRYPLIFTHQDRVYPSLALELAELVKEDQIEIQFSNDSRIEKMAFSKTSEQLIPSTRLGYLDLNFRGASRSFEYVSVWDVLSAAESEDPEIINTVQNKLKDATVLFGVTALGLYDMRAFPFDSNTPGVEGHATALDNLLSNDALRSATSIHLDWLPLTALILLGLLFAGVFSTLEAIPSLLVFFGFVALVGWFDVEFLFARAINFPSAFLLIEILLVFTVILAVRYILEEKNKKFIRAAFSRYLAPQVVDLVLKDPSKLAVGGERRDLSVLFSDLRGFTTLSEGMDPKTLTQFLNEYLSEMTEIIFEHEGTLDKYIGDAVMAFWGAPIHQDDHATRAAQAAIAMQRRTHEIASRFKQKYGVDLKMGVGVNSGDVSVGNMGSDRIFEYTVIGDHVNLASRLEGLTKLYGVGTLCSQNTLQKIKDPESLSIYSRVIDEVKVKGKKNTTSLIELSLSPFDLEAMEHFKQGQLAFRNREWDAAIKYFELSSQKFESTNGTSDSVCTVFTERCLAYKLNPPPQTWDGSIEMREK